MKKRRPDIGMHFKCCNVYVKIRLNADGTAYAGHCPKCSAKVTIPVGRGGKRSRFWSTE